MGTTAIQERTKTTTHTGSLKFSTRQFHSLSHHRLPHIELFSREGTVEGQWGKESVTGTIIHTGEITHGHSVSHGYLTLEFNDKSYITFFFNATLSVEGEPTRGINDASSFHAILSVRDGGGRFLGMHGNGHVKGHRTTSFKQGDSATATFSVHLYKD